MTPRHSRLHQPAVGLLPQPLSHRGRRVSPRITQRPFVLDRCPASDTHGGCTRQAAPRTGGTPGAAPALLLRRLPGEARPARKGMLTRCPIKCHVVSVHAVDSCGQCDLCVCVCVETPANPPFPESCQLPYCAGMGEAKPNIMLVGIFHTGGYWFCKNMTKKACNNVQTNHSSSVEESRLLSKPLHVIAITSHEQYVVVSVI